MSSKGSLYLVPTPISEVGDISQQKKDKLLKAFNHQSILCVEDLKPARRRWRGWGLPREAIESFVCFNEHTSSEQCEHLIAELKSGKDIFLMSDGGMPALCDPGQNLVDQCHKNELLVKALETDNSIALAMALSGYDHSSFFFSGFPPKRSDQRSEFFKNLVSKTAVILMDTPYRLERTLMELKDHWPQREVCFCLNMCQEDQVVYRGVPGALTKVLKGKKINFVAVLAPV